MERMVQDPVVSHVLIYCDREYVEKANARKRGVGTEAQIISQQVYEKLDQQKFIAIFCKMDDSGEPYLPTFLASRIGIDFSSDERVNENWEQLIRALHGKPRFEKPRLGGIPAYLEDDSARPSLPTVGKFASLREALLNSRPSAAALRLTFLDTAMEYAEGFRISEELSQEELESRMEQDLHALVPLRDQLVDWVLLEATTVDDGALLETLTDFLEKCLSLKYRTPAMTRWNDVWWETQNIFVYEMFLYAVAVLIKTNRFGVLHDVLSGSYLRPETAVSGGKHFCRIDEFDGYSSLLQAKNDRAKNRRISPVADLIKARATRKDLPFEDIMQADLTVFISELINGSGDWIPKALIFGERSRLKFFVRAGRHSDFLKVAQVFGVDSADELRTRILGSLEQSRFRLSSLSFDGNVSPWNLAHADAFDTLP